MVTLALVGCGGSSTPDELPLADLSGVEPAFRGTTTPMSELMGIAYQLPVASTPAATAERTCCGT